VSKHIVSVVVVGVLLVAVGAGASWAAFQAGAPAGAAGGQVVPVICDQHGTMLCVARGTSSLPAEQRAAMIAERLTEQEVNLGTAFIAGPCGATDIWVNTAKGPRRLLTVWSAEARALGAPTTTIAAHWANCLRWVCGNVAAPVGFTFDRDATWRTIPEKVEPPAVPEGVKVADLALYGGRGCGCAAMRGWGQGCGGCGGYGGWDYGRGSGGCGWGGVSQWDPACGMWTDPGPCGYWRDPCAERWDPCATPCWPRGAVVGDGTVRLWRAGPCP